MQAPLGVGIEGREEEYIYRTRVLKRRDFRPSLVFTNFLDHEEA